MHCINCFNSSDFETVCPACGFDMSEYHRSDAHLAPGTILDGRYEIGRVIGEGGFGITYAAFDTKLGNKCAIKEYFPRQFSTRDNSDAGHTNIKYITGAEQDFSDGLRRFRNEAMKLAGFDGIRSIVNVKGYLSENNTGYIVMNFVEGISLKEYLHEHREIISADNAFSLIKPIFTALSEIEKAGIIHRDISPDNIIIGSSGEPVLIDFGSAREYDKDKSISVILKHGYAPPEQYSSAGVQGPWTDIYALCATIYRMITGIVPADAMDRIDGKEKISPPSKLGVKISKQRENAIMKGLAVNADDRWKTISELYNALYIQDNSSANKKRHMITAASAAAVLCVLVGTVLIFPHDTEDAAAENIIPAAETDSVLPVTETDIYADIASGELENGSWYITYDGILNINAAGKLDIDNKIWLQYRDDIKKAVLSDSITEIGDGAFKRLSSLEAVMLPDGLRSIGAEAFAHTALNDADIPESVGYIGEKAFEDCSSLCSVKLPSALNEICDRTFFGCLALEKIELSDTLKNIGSKAFYKSGVKNVILPANNIYIGENAFGECNRLESVTFPAECVPVTADGGQFAWGNSLSDIFFTDGISQETAINVLSSLEVSPASYYNVHFPENIDIPDELVNDLPTYITAVGKSGSPAMMKLTDAMYSVEFTDDFVPDFYVNRDTLYINSDRYTGFINMEISANDSDYITNITEDQFLDGGMIYYSQLEDYLLTLFPGMDIQTQVDLPRHAIAAKLSYAPPEVSWDPNNVVRDPFGHGYYGDSPQNQIYEERVVYTYFSEISKNAAAIKKVVLGSNVTRLESTCLSNYCKMESIFIPRTVTEISDFAFNCPQVYTTPGDSGYIEYYANRFHHDLEYVENAEVLKNL